MSTDTHDRQHFALVLRVIERGWLTLARDNGDWRAIDASSQSLDGVLEPTLRRIGLNPTADFSFSNARDATAFMDAAHWEQPTAAELKALLPGYSLTVLAPIGHPDYAGQWANLWRDPRGGLSATPRSRFVDSELVRQVEGWFRFYGPRKIETGRCGALELLIRREWSASALLPEAFPSKTIPKPSPAVVARQQRAAKINTTKAQVASQRASQGYERGASGAWARTATEE